MPMVVPRRSTGRVHGSAANDQRTRFGDGLGTRRYRRARERGSCEYHRLPPAARRAHAFPLHRGSALRGGGARALCLCRPSSSSSRRSWPLWASSAGSPESLAHDRRPQSHVVADALFICLLGCGAVVALLMIFPEAMFPNSGLNGFDRLFPLVVFAIAIADVALAACAFQYNIAATVRARSVVEPWTISIASAIFFFYSRRDGLILSYAAAMVAALLASLWPLVRHYGLPRGWSAPSPAALAHDAAQPAARRGRCHRVGHAPSGSGHSRPVRSALCRGHLLCRAAGRLAPAEAQDQLRADSWTRHHAQHRARQSRRDRASGEPGRLLDRRRPARHRARARHSGRGGHGPGRPVVRRRHRCPCRIADGRGAGPRPPWSARRRSSILRAIATCSFRWRPSACRRCSRLRSS